MIAWVYVCLTSAMIDVILLEKSKQYPSYPSPSVHTALGEGREMGIIALYQASTELK